MPIARIKSLKDAVQQAIDGGARSVEDVHKRIAAMPFEQLQKIAAVEGLAQKARGKHDETVGAVYDTIRRVNARVGELADSALNRVSRQG